MRRAFCTTGIRYSGKFPDKSWKNRSPHTNLFTQYTGTECAFIINCLVTTFPVMCLCAWHNLCIVRGNMPGNLPVTFPDLCLQFSTCTPLQYGSLPRIN